jgi:predicted SAM-dependent methyltransferase
MTKKLHLGCGKNYIPGFINVDLFSSIQADIYADLTALPFDANSFDLIYSSHCLEHVHRRCVLSTLAHWRHLIAPGGTLRLAVPDFAACVKWYNQTGDLESIMGLLYAGQTHPKNNHFVTFDEKYLTMLLEKVGFTNIRRWDWKTTEHAAYDDYSQAFLPSHHDKVNGLLASLNLEATKPL